MAEALVGGDGFAVDASLIRADSNRRPRSGGDGGMPTEAKSRAAPFQRND